MKINPIKNIPLKTFRDYLKWNGLQLIRTSGGHEIWNKDGLTRPVVLQSHISPVPANVVRNSLITLGVTADNYIEFLKS